MARIITKSHLAFVQEAKEAFEKNIQLESYTSEADGFELIALRYGLARDCVMVYELGQEIGNFAQQCKPSSSPRKAVRLFSFDMEEQLRVNEHKGGWSNEHNEFLLLEMKKNITSLIVEMQKQTTDKHEITIRCANIANFAMMIADNEGEHL